MKTSLDLPDDLYRQVKARSALEGRTVREVATALFAAWVAGDVQVHEGAASSSSPHDPNDPREQWLARWQSLGQRVQQAAYGTPDSPNTPSLVDQLQRDRR
jgi:non-ribosomal peptide synthetase component F